ncbi:MAG: hypothetical protein IKC89_02895 [Lentisphaeria bacterium]|nr:hypothetical protein [Lentisphaeria bacterium]
MRSKAATIKKFCSGKRRRSCSGQAIAEYVVFLAATLVLIMVLVFLLRAVGEHGEFTVERIGYSVP